MKSLWLIILMVYTLPTIAKDDTLLWEISGNGLVHSSYLFGTVHLICEEPFAFKPKVIKALNQAEQMYLEMDMDDDEQMLYLMSNISLKETSLRALINDDDEKRVDDLLQKHLAMPLDQLNKIRPFAVYSILIEKMMDCDLPITYETELIEYVEGKNYAIEGLETAAQQLQFIERSGMDNIEGLIQLLENFQVNEEQMNQLFDAYRKEDLQLLDKLVRDSSKDMGYDLSVLIDQRNQNWVEKIPQVAANKSTFFAVGAGHLYGEKGLIALLRDQGLSVTPIH